MDFLPFLMMMNNFKNGTQNNSQFDGMLKNLNTMQKAGSGGNNMDMIMNMLGNSNPQIQNIMKMFNMMNKMKNSNMGDMEMLKNMFPNNQPNNDARTQSHESPQSCEQNCMSQDKTNNASNNSAMHSQNRTQQKDSQNMTMSQENQAPQRKRNSINPLSPISKVANKDIIYMMNNYINN